MGFLISALPLLIPLALILVPVFRIHHVPRKNRKVAWELIIAVIAAAALAIVSHGAGDDRQCRNAAGGPRPSWSRSKTSRATSARSALTAARTSRLGEGDGCDAKRVEPGDEIQVLYDPEGIAGPADERHTSSYTEVIGGLAALIVATGTCGCLQMNRWNNEYDENTP